MSVFSAVRAGEVLAAAANLIMIKAPTADKVEVLEAYITQINSEVSDQIHATWFKATTDGTATTTLTPLSLDNDGETFGGTVTSAWSVAPSLAASPIVSRGFNALNGFSYVPVPESRFIIDPAERRMLRINSNPASATFVAEVIFRVL